MARAVHAHVKSLEHRLATTEQPGSSVQQKTLAWRLTESNGIHRFIQATGDDRWLDAFRKEPGYVVTALGEITPPPEVADEQGEECFCAARGIGVPGVSCGDWPRCSSSHPEALVTEQVSGASTAAWFAVCDALDAVDPNWMMHGPVGVDAAVACIRRLAARDCQCIDCFGDQPNHDPSCVYMNELHGEARGDIVLVPREPTEAMRAAGREAHYEAEEKAQHAWDAGKNGMSWRENRAAHVYAAMLAVAPEPVLAAAPAAPGVRVDRNRIGQAISDFLCGISDDGAVTLDPFDARNIDAIVDVVTAATAGKDGA
jgi:hypothetical protein